MRRMGWITLMQLLIMSHAVLQTHAREIRDIDGKEIPEDVTADFVIVGGGTAGCVLASRICRGLDNATVLLLERGKPRTTEQDLLVKSVKNFQKVWKDTDMSELWPSEPNLGMGNRTVVIVAGSTMGGSSTMNLAQVTVPKYKEVLNWGFDFDEETMDHMYQKVFDTMRFQIPSPQFRQKHGAILMDIAERAGFKADKSGNDLTAREMSERPLDSVMYNTMAVDYKQWRVDASEGYLHQIGNRCRNLQVVQAATAVRVVVENGTAVGVEYMAQGKKHTARARREVLVSAGPFGSPKLLQLSGIGPKGRLPKDIPLVLDLPVGTSTQGRAFVNRARTYAGVEVPPESDPEQVFSDAAFKQWKSGNGGPLATPVTNLYGRMSPAKGNSYFSLGFSAGISGPGTPLNSWTIGCVVNPTARGSLMIKSSDPFEPPAVSLNLMGTPKDKQDAANCLGTLDTTSALIEPPFESTPIPPTDAEGNPFASAIDEVTAKSQFAWHFVGGCRVGEVVDGQARVKGIQQLRVVDSSALPEIPEFAGPMSSVYMLAEYVADLIVRRSSS